MKVFQIVCALLLVSSVAGGIWFMSSPLTTVHVLFVNDSRATIMTNTAKQHLTTFANQHDHFTFSLITDLSDLQTQIGIFSDHSEVIVLGCFTEVCKLNVVAELGPDNTTPYLYTGRSNGLISASYLWNFGPVFNQISQPILGVLERLNLLNPVVISDESVSSYLTSNVLHDLTQAKNWHGSKFINVEQDLSLKSLEALLLNKNKQAIINTICHNKGERILEKLNRSNIMVFNTCLTYSERYKNGYFSSVITQDNSVSEEEYLFNLALYFIKVYVVHPEINFSQLVNFEFPVNGQTVVMDFKNRHIWHQVKIIAQSTRDPQVLYNSQVLLRPVIYHQLRQPSEWQLMLQLYWRNHNGSWGA